MEELGGGMDFWGYWYVAGLEGYDLRSSRAKRARHEVDLEWVEEKMEEWGMGGGGGNGGKGLGRLESMTRNKPSNKQTNNKQTNKPTNKQAYLPLVVHWWYTARYSPPQFVPTEHCYSLHLHDKTSGKSKTTHYYHHCLLTLRS